MIFLTEIWANIKNYPDYQVSNLGNVRSYKNGMVKVINGWVQNTGYRTVSLNNKKISIHRLVAETFIYKPEGKDVVNHKDGNKLNNKIENLEWCTNKENIQHAYSTGLMNSAINQMSLKKIRAKRVGQFNLRDKFIKEFRGSVEAENALKQRGIRINARNIRQVCEGKRKTAGGFKWRYL